MFSGRSHLSYGPCHLLGWWKSSYPFLLNHFTIRLLDFALNRQLVGETHNKFEPCFCRRETVGAFFVHQTIHNRWAMGSNLWSKLHCIYWKLRHFLVHDFIDQPTNRNETSPLLRNYKIFVLFFIVVVVIIIKAFFQLY